MGYEDHLRNVQPTKPACWGQESCYNPNDTECVECRFKHSCAAAVERSTGHTQSIPVYTAQPIRPVSPPVYNAEPLSTRIEAGYVSPQESATSRFFKDALTGALRGMFYEMYCFWKNFRIK